MPPGVTPRSGWAVDPFGHSSTMPYLLKRSNLTGMLIQRVHYAIKKHFAATQNLEFMWRQTWGRGCWEVTAEGTLPGQVAAGNSYQALSCADGKLSTGCSVSALQWFCPEGQPQGDSPAASRGGCCTLCAPSG